MDEVKRYTATEVRFSTQGGSFVLEADFVARETALREELADFRSMLSNNSKVIDRVLEEKAELRTDASKILKHRIDERDDALQRLTVAEQRNTERDTEIAAQVESALRRSFTLGQIYWQQADSDSTCQQNKCDQTMEVQAQHILNVLKSVSAAINKPEEAKS